MRAACDRLIASTTRHPYGWAWATTQDGKSTIFLEPDDTPAKTLVLFRAGDVLHDAKYTDAALQVCRTISLVQQSSGYIPPIATLNSQRPSGKAPAAGVPARESTCAAAVVLMLAGQVADPKATRFAAAGRLGESWIAIQQLGTGVFAMPTTQEALGHHLPRQIALDNSDVRDCYLTMALCGEVDQSRVAQTAAEKCAKRLMALRLMNQSSSPSTEQIDDADINKSHAGLHLWSKSYGTAGEVSDNATSADVAASSFALQVLAVQQQLHPATELLQALNDASRALALLRQSDGTWTRLVAGIPTTRPTTAPDGSFFGPRPALPTIGQYDLPDLLAGIGNAPATRPAADDLNLRMAATVCHLIRSPFQAVVAADATDLQTLWWNLDAAAKEPH